MSLLAGMESKTKVLLLIKLTSITSESLIDSICDHLCGGNSKGVAAALNGITAGEVTRSMKQLNKANDIVVKIEECDWDRFIKNS